MHRIRLQGFKASRLQGFPSLSVRGSLVHEKRSFPRPQSSEGKPYAGLHPLFGKTSLKPRKGFRLVFPKRG
jgi:hypothetical protein